MIEANQPMLTHPDTIYLGQNLPDPTGVTICASLLDAVRLAGERSSWHAHRRPDPGVDDDDDDTTPIGDPDEDEGYDDEDDEDDDEEPIQV